MPVNRTEELRKELKEASKAYYDLVGAHYNEAMQRFESLGGCPICRGRGWVVVWDTLDSMFMSGCYHESDRCPRDPLYSQKKRDSNWWQERHADHADTCTVETRRASGLSPENTKYDTHHARATWHPTGEQEDEQRKLFEVMRNVERDLDAEVARWSFRKGVLVEVVSQRARGRNRLPLGTRGVIKAIPRTQWGIKYILRLPNGDEVWTTDTDLQVIDPEPDLVALGFETKVGFPCLSTFKGWSKSGASVKVTNLLAGKDVWMPISQINDVQVHENDEWVDVDLDNVQVDQTIVLFVDRWLAVEKGFAAKEG